MLMADTPALAPEYSYYQRLLARDPERGRRPHRATHQDRAAQVGLRRLAAAGAQLCGTRSTGAAAVVGGRDGRHRRDARAAGRRRGVDPRACSRQPSPIARGAAAAGLHANRCACWAMRSTASPTRSRSRCSPSCVDDLPIVVEISEDAHAGLGARGAGQGAGRLRRLHRRSATQPAVEDALSGQAASRRVAGCADPRGALGARRRSPTRARRSCGMRAPTSSRRRSRRPGCTWAVWRRSRESQ